jgi:hypothetical protein
MCLHVVRSLPRTTTSDTQTVQWMLQRGSYRTAYPVATAPGSVFVQGLQFVPVMAARFASQTEQYLPCKPCTIRNLASSQ